MLCLNPFFIRSSIHSPGGATTLSWTVTKSQSLLHQVKHSLAHSPAPCGAWRVTWVSIPSSSGQAFTRTSGGRALQSSGRSRLNPFFIRSSIHSPGRSGIPKKEACWSQSLLHQVKHSLSRDWSERSRRRSRVSIPSSSGQAFTRHPS